MITEETLLSEAARKRPHAGAPGVQEAPSLLDLLLNAPKSSEVGAKQKVSGAWRDVRWTEIIERTKRLSEGLISLGIAPGDRVCIFAATRLEWALADLAIMGARAISVPIYTSNTPQEVEYIVNNSGARALFFDNDNPDGKPGGRLAKLLEIRDRIKGVERLIALDMPSRPDQGVTGISELEEQGARALSASPKAFEERVSRIGREDIACILYTSGTTGLPKGVMLTHGNWTYQSWAVEQVQLLMKGDTVLLFLPLAHSFAKVCETAWIGQGFKLAFAEAAEKAADNAAEVEATVLPAVPRVYEKAFAKVLAEGSAQPGVKGRLFAWAMRLFEEHAAARIAGREHSSLAWTLAKRLVFTQIEKKLKARFGDHMRMFVSGGAPLPRKIAFFFELCGLSIIEGYGLTETAAPTHANRLGAIRVGTVGPPFPKVEQKLAEDGEILLRGPQVMKGYYQMPEETALVLDSEGFLHTGDIGEIDPEGYLTITDRKKDLIKTSGGKYVAPQELENALKVEPLISQVVVLGDRRRYISALITLSEEGLLKLADEQAIPERRYGRLAQHPAAHARVKAAVDAVNATLPSYATIKRFTILDQDFSQIGGELTPKLSVRRKVVTEKLKATIDALYDGESYE